MSYVLNSYLVTYLLTHGTVAAKVITEVPKWS